tara:strand:+ start:313 stop:702 length:390 start_codon:yes stop_codon:yes gene_type:complete
MTDNVIPFGRLVQDAPMLSEEEQGRVLEARKDFQDFIFDEYEAPNIDTANPNRGKRLTPLPHMFSMLLPDYVVLQALNDTEAPEEWGDIQRLSYYTMNVLSDLNDISNTVFGTGFVDTQHPKDEPTDKD